MVVEAQQRRPHGDAVEEGRGGPDVVERHEIHGSIVPARSAASRCGGSHLTLVAFTLSAQHFSQLGDRNLRDSYFWQNPHFGDWITTLSES
ncbi:hypothetical protein GCM10022243_67850 [Saccharothrix violaceirubra]